MTIIKISLFIIIALLTFSYKPSKHCQLSNNIFYPYSKELNQKGLKVAGFGGGMMDDIQRVYGDYSSKQRHDVDQARKLYVEVAEGLIKKYNEDKIIRPYLHDFPFTIANVEIDIEFNDDENHWRSDGSVAVMYVKQGTLVYKGYDAKAEQLYTLFKEPYEEAVKSSLRK